MDKVHEFFKFFSELSPLFRTWVDSPWSRYPNHERDLWDAIGILLEGYAFERQGRNPSYGHVAADVIREMRGGIPVDDPTSPALVWREFCERLHNKDLNEQVNPLCPKGTPYEITYKSKGTTQKRTTPKLSAIEVAAALAPATITAFALQRLRDDSAYEVAAVERKLTEINGVREKIARLFLRDMAIQFEVPVQHSAAYLQPIDIHIRRICKRLMCEDNAKDEEIRGWLVKESMKAGVVAGAVNQGMWYFGAQIAGSEHRTNKAIDNLSYAKELVDSYIGRLSQVVENWKTLR